MVAANWHALTTFVDNACDNAFGVECRAIPWSRNEDRPDYNRPGSMFVGIYVSPDASSEATGGGFTSMQANAALRFSVQRKFIENVQQYDHVEILDPLIGGRYEISMIDPGDTDRATLHLLRMKGMLP